MDIICCYPKGFRSQVVVSSLPPCSLSLLRRGAETGAVPARSPVPSLPGRGSECQMLPKRCHCSSLHADGVHLSVVVMGGSKNLKAFADTQPVH